MEKAETARLLDFVINEEFSPFRIGHQAGSQVNPISYTGVLTTLITANHARIGRANGHPGPKAPVVLFLGWPQLLPQTCQKLQRSFNIVLKCNRRSEENGHEPALVAKINLLEIAREYINLPQYDVSKLIQLLVIIDPGKGKEDRDDGSELPFLLVVHYGLRQKSQRCFPGQLITLKRRREPLDGARPDYPIGIFTHRR